MIDLVTFLVGRGERIRTSDPSVPKRPWFAGLERLARGFPRLPPVSSRPDERQPEPFLKFPSFFAANSNPRRLDERSGAYGDLTASFSRGAFVHWVFRKMTRAVGCERWLDDSGDETALGCSGLSIPACFGNQSQEQLLCSPHISRALPLIGLHRFPRAVFPDRRGCDEHSVSLRRKGKVVRRAKRVKTKPTAAARLPAPHPSSGFATHPAFGDVASCPGRPGARPAGCFPQGAGQRPRAG